MSRPHKHPRTGVYWLRRRVPADLVASVGRAEVTRSLETKDPTEARRLHALALADMEAQWANLRAGPRALTEREAHALAAKVFENWLSAHRDYLSDQFLWHPELFEDLWTASPLPEREPEPERPGEVPIENLFRRSMRRFCFEQADLGLALHGFAADEDNRFRMAKAVAAAMQRASTVLTRGGYMRRARPRPSQPGRNATTALPQRGAAEPERALAGAGGKGETLTGLLRGWWQEGQAAGLKPSTHESYRNTFDNLVALLKRNEAGRVTKADVIRFKEHRLTTPSPRTGRPASAKTVKDSDLVALKAVFGWAVANGRLTTNPAAGVTVRVSKPAKLRSKGFTDDEARAILRAALDHEPGQESPRTSASKRRANQRPWPETTAIRSAHRPVDQGGAAQNGWADKPPHDANAFPTPACRAVTAPAARTLGQAGSGLDLLIRSPCTADPRAASPSTLSDRPVSTGR